MKVVLWDKTKPGLKSKTDWLVDKLKSSGFYFYEEYLGHDLEFFKSIPAHTIFTNRAHRVLASNYVDLLPISRTSRGDLGEKNPLFMRNRFGELYGFDPFGSTRNNWNSMVLGASGSGKSVTMNMLIAHAMYPRIAAEGGKIFILDFAGAEKSSYLKMAKLFGGKFLPIDASGAISINPFPPQAEVLLGRGTEDEPPRRSDQNTVGGRWNTTTLTFLNIVLDLILANRGEGMESDIFRGIISRAIMELYKKVPNPTLKDVLSFIHDEDREKEAILKKLLTGFLSSPESKLVSGQGTISYGNEPFVIFDLQGISSLPPKLQELVTFIVVEEARKAAFRTSGCKFIIFDEVAQLIKDHRMVSLIDEMYSTARKHRSSIWTITQNFLSYKESALSSKIKINTTTTIFLSHAADEEAKRLVAADFGFSDQERSAFASLHTKKGEYSLALIRTITNRGEDAEVVRIELSPLDYWLATSDDRDNERLAEIMREQNCSIIEACHYAATQRTAS
jgi:type IV secretory pathway VirB4 component